MTNKPIVKLLVSYAYYKPRDLDELLFDAYPDVQFELFGDSGAFTVFKKGGTIDVKDYGNWIKQWKHRLGAYANLDVINSAEMSNENLMRLQDMGLEPLPVYHAGEPADFFYSMLESYNYICFGGIAYRNYAGEGSQRVYLKALRAARDKGVRMHAFGLTNWKVIRRLPFFSYDSTTWVSAARFGRISLFDEHKGNMTVVAVGRNLEYAKWASWLYYFEKWGYDWKTIVKWSITDNKLMAELGALAYQIAERWLQKHHDPIPGINGLLPGPKIYIALSAVQYIPHIIRAARKVQQCAV